VVPISVYGKGRCWRRKREMLVVERKEFSRLVEGQELVRQEQAVGQGGAPLEGGEKKESQGGAEKGC
jgi:hypothetical protein